VASEFLSDDRKCLVRGHGFVARVVIGALVSMTVAATAPPAGSGEDVLQYLGRTIDWYRRVASLGQTPISTQEVVFRDTARQSTRRVLQLGFDFARAQAALLSANQKSSTSAPAAAGGDRERNLALAAAAAVQRVNQLQTQIDQIERDIQNASATSRPTLNARRDKLVAELNLAKARQEVVQNLSEFVSGPGSGAAGGLLEKIADLERSVPDAQNDQSTKSGIDASAAASQQMSNPDSAGIIGLVSEMFTLSQKMGNLKDLAQDAARLRERNDKLRLPIRTELLDAIHRGDALAAAGEVDDPQTLAAQRKELDALAARFKLVSAAAVPLGEQNILLDASRTNLLAWRDALNREYHGALRHLLVRLGAIAVAILVLLGISKLWRRATFRYVSDGRRRVQFLLLRRIVIGCLIVIVVVAGVATELGSLATYAGLLTAGIAVALQSVILSGAAYFFFIGRYGVRVGDRVTISGITGDVVDTGLFRLYLMELAGGGRDLNPTGRLVVFSNSVLFQPSPFFKQVPGADYVWHEVALTLAPESDYHLAEQRLLAAIESVYAEYREEIERQHSNAMKMVHVQMPPPRPEGRLRFVDAGLEFAVRYPVDIRRAAEIDDRVTRKLVEAIDEEPKLKLVASSTPKIQPANSR